MALAPLIIVPILLICFAGVWLAICQFLLGMAGWQKLVAAFPDNGERSITNMFGQSGMLGGVSFGGILNLAACPTGMRVSISKLFGPFAASFLVSWQWLEIERRPRAFRTGFRKMAAIGMGRPAVKTLLIPNYVADGLAYAAGKNWPERGPFQDNYWRRAALDVLYGWLFVVVFFGGIASLNAFGGGEPPTVGLMIFLAVGVFFGIPIWGMFVWRFLRR